MINLDITDDEQMLMVFVSFDHWVTGFLLEYIFYHSTIASGVGVKLFMTNNIYGDKTAH